MKRIVLYLVCLVAVIFMCNLGYGQEKWFKLPDGKEYVTDFTLDAGGSKSITINSDNEIGIGFKSDMTFEEGQEYKSKDFKTMPNYPIKIEQQNIVKARPEDTVASFSGTFGGGTIFGPVDGKIVVNVSNNAKMAHKIVIYTYSNK